MKVVVRSAGTDKRFGASSQRIEVPIWQVFDASTNEVVQGPFDAVADAKRWVKASPHVLA